MVGSRHDSHSRTNSLWRVSWYAVCRYAPDDKTCDKRVLLSCSCTAKDKKEHSQYRYKPLTHSLTTLPAAKLPIYPHKGYQHSSSSDTYCKPLLTPLHPALPSLTLSDIYNTKHPALFQNPFSSIHPFHPFPAAAPHAYAFQHIYIARVLTLPIHPFTYPFNF